MKQPLALTCLLLLLLGWDAHQHGAAAADHDCAALDDPSVRHFDVRIPVIEVPENEMTTYVCQVLKVPVPVDQDYHAVAFKPLINNHDVMHHMILFSCNGNEMEEEFTEPHTCGKADNVCRSWMAQWSLGVDGTICTHRDTGVRFGRSVGSYLMLQLHWNNADFKPNMTDSSGMRVYYTNSLRPNDLGHVQVGQQEIIIPPGVTRHAQSGGCSRECTRMLFPEPIHITNAHLHMHYLGAGGWLEVIHTDGSITRVMHDDSYDFSRPPVHHLHPTVTVNPGDYLRLTCLFSSKDGIQQRNRTVYFGEGSDGEMCYAFLAYYPKIAGFDQCLELDSHDLNCRSDSNSVFQECMSTFLSTMRSQFIPDIISACNKTEEELCFDGCKQALDGLAAHECMQGKLGGYLERVHLPRLAAWQDLVDARTRFTASCGRLAVM